MGSSNYKSSVRFFFHFLFFVSLSFPYYWYYTKFNKISSFHRHLKNAGWNSREIVGWLSNTLHSLNSMVLREVGHFPKAWEKLHWIGSTNVRKQFILINIYCFKHKSHLKIFFPSTLIYVFINTLLWWLKGSNPVPVNYVFTDLLKSCQGIEIAVKQIEIDNLWT